MKNIEKIAASYCVDPVLGEMARLANLISNDSGITRKERVGLIRRLEAEHYAYVRPNWLDAIAATPAATITAFGEGLIPTIRIMSDFCGFSHQIILPPNEDQAPEGRRNVKNLLTPALTAELAAWQEEFEDTAWNDYRSDRTRSMQWVVFDCAGLQIAKKIKQHVQGRARVIYEKAIQNPFNRYDGHLEVLSDGNILCRDDDPELTRILNASLSAPTE